MGLRMSSECSPVPYILTQNPECVHEQVQVHMVLFYFGNSIAWFSSTNAVDDSTVSQWHEKDEHTSHHA